MTARLPVGTVTLVLADIKGSVRRWEASEAEMSAAMRQVEVLVGAGLDRYGGARPLEQGDGYSFVAAFSRSSDAIGFAVEFLLAMEAETWPEGVLPRFRVGVHAGEVDLRDDETTYEGPEINRCARVRDLGSGGHILMTRAAHDLVVDRLPPRTEVRDLGVHSLRDLARPEQIFQVVHPDLPAHAPTFLDDDLERLPPALTSFVGRAAELSELAALLESSRVVTLTGAGGSGKTRLATECARSVRLRYLDGVRWVDLSTTSTDDLVWSDVLRAVGATPSPDAEPSDTVVGHLAGREVLLVLDNCEHVVSACCELVDQVVLSCPRVTIMATSREPLGVAGEVGWRVSSLPVPPGDATASEVTGAESGQLFVERATQVRSNFQLTDDNAPAVASICRRLDGIPLAIELAAARVRTLSPAQIVESLDDRFRVLTGGPRTAMPRQRALEASVDWSYALLTGDERLLLARLSVLAGSFELDVAEDVCADTKLPRGRVLDALSGLVDRSMVVFDDTTGSGCYRLLETIKVYARTKLDELGDVDSTRDRHLQAHIRLAEQVQLDQLESIDVALARFDSILDNLRAAMDWSVSSDNPLAALAIIAPTFDAWLVRGLYVEATTRLKAGLSSSGVPAGQRARGLADASMMALMAGQYAGSFDFAQSAVEIAGDHDQVDVHARAFAYRGWSGYHSGRGTNDQIWDDLGRAVGLGEVIGDPLLLTRLRMLAGWVEACSRSVPTGRSLLEDALHGSQEAGAVNFEIPVRNWLATTCLLDGDLASALAHGNEAVRLGRQLGYDAFVIQALTALGNVCALSGDIEEGRRHFAEATSLAEGPLAPFAIAAYSQAACGEALLGDAETAAEFLDNADRLLRDVPYGVAGSHFLLAARGLLAHRHGDLASARRVLTDLHANCTDPTLTLLLAMAGLWLARIAEEDQHPEDAWELAHDALDIVDHCGTALLLPTALESIASVAATTSREDLAARMLGRASRVRDERDALDTPQDVARRSAAESTSRVVLGDEDFDRLRAEGAGLSAREMIAYARRGRGSRGRPASGWDSLTPAERNVVDHAVQGRTNAQIAESLFVSVNTVRTHLSHVYTKLGISNRTELASAANARASVPDTRQIWPSPAVPRKDRSR